MKKTYSLYAAFVMLITLFINTFSANAQGGAPSSVNYQAVARNASGALITNQSVKVRFTFHANSAAGTIEYQETQNLTTNQYGLFTALIGQGTVTQGSWSGITFGSADQFLQVEFDPTGGSSYSNMGTSQLVSVPYALNSKTSDFASNSYWALSGSDITNSNVGTVSIGGAPSGFGQLSITPLSGNDVIDAGDPIDGYAFYCVKSGSNSGIWMEKSSTTSSTPAINGMSHSDLGMGVEGYNSGAGMGIRGYSETGTGVWGEVYDNTLGYAGNFVGRVRVSCELSLGGIDGIGLAVNSPQGLSAYPGLSLYSSSSSTGAAIFGVVGSSALNVGDYAGIGWGDLNAASFNVVSDARMKRDINTISSSFYDKYMNYIRNIQSATFWYKSESNEKRSVPHIGLIAQSLPAELKAKISEKSGSPSEERIGVSLADLSGLMLVGVKALDEKTTTMEQTIKTQQEEIELLKAQLQAIQTKLDAAKK